MKIKSIVDKLKRKYGTSNPFELAKCLNIIILHEELGEIKGYYNKFARQKFIHLNVNLEDNEMSFTCAHELGHAVIHPSSNTPFLKENTLFSLNKLEMEANQFSVDLILDDEEIKNLLEEHFYTADTLSNLYGIDKRIIEFKIKRIYKNEYTLK